MLEKYRIILMRVKFIFQHHFMDNEGGLNVYHAKIATSRITVIVFDNTNSI